MQTGLELIMNSERYQSANLYFWKRTGANAEVDYVIQKNDSIIPIEVKSNKTGKMQSMAVYLKTHDTPYGLRISLENFDYSSFQSYQIHIVTCQISSSTSQGILITGFSTDQFWKTWFTTMQDHLDTKQA